MIRNIRWAIVWGYAVELIGATTVYGLIVVVFGVQPTSRFVQDTCDEWNDLTGILLAAALTVWLTFINIRGSLFGEYLARNRDDTVYSRAFLTAMVVFFLATAAMIFARGIKGDAVAHVALWLLLYSAINLYSMMNNATDLIKLYSEFQKGLEIERIKTGMERKTLTDGDR